MARGGISTAPAFGFGTGAPAKPPAQPVESWTVTAAEIEAWLKTAREGDRMIYARGPSLIQGAAAALVRRLAADGEVIPNNRPLGDDCSEYLITRRRIRVVTERQPVIDPNMMSVLVVIQDAAQNGQRCPSDDALGAETGLTAGQVKWQLKRLTAAKMIECRVVPVLHNPRFRVVKVVATGMETRGPE